MRLDRRTLIATGATAFAFSGLARSVAARDGEDTYLNEVTGYGPLVADPNRLLDLPEGFSYRVISGAGEAMDDGFITPDKFDGMAGILLSRGPVQLSRRVWRHFHFQLQQEPGNDR